MNTTITRTEVLVTDLDRYTSRLEEIAAGIDADRPRVRAGVIAESAITAIWAHTQEPQLKAALDRLMKALNAIH